MAGSPATDRKGGGGDRMMSRGSTDEPRLLAAARTSNLSVTSSVVLKEAIWKSSFMIQVEAQIHESVSESYKRDKRIISVSELRRKNGFLHSKIS